MVNYIELRKGKENNVILVLDLWLSFFVFVYCLLSIDNMNGPAKFIFLLPLFYLIGNVILLSRTPSFIGRIIFYFYSVQFILFPCLVCTNNGINFSQYNNNVCDNFIFAMLLQGFVLLVVVFKMLLFKQRNLGLSELVFEPCVDRKKSNTVKIVIGLMITISVTIIIMYPQLLNKYRPIVFTNDASFYSYLVLSDQVKNNTPTIIYYFGFWIVNTVRFLLGYIIIIRIWSRFYNKAETIGVLVSLLVAIALSSITTEDRAATVYVGISYMILILGLYSKKRKLIMILGASVVIISMAYILFIIPLGSAVKMSSYMLSKINAYFSCTINVSAGFAMTSNSHLSCFLGDILRSIPIVKGLFTNMPMSYLVFNDALAVDTTYYSQILPMISQGYFYLGIIGAALLPCIMISIIYKSFRKICSARHTFDFFLYSVIMTLALCSLFMYDFALFFSLFLDYCLPLLAIRFVANKKISAKKT